MVDFTTLLNRGHKRYIEKHVRRRKFGKCEGCQSPALLIEYIDTEDSDFKWSLCNQCYDKMLLTSE